MKPDPSNDITKWCVNAAQRTYVKGVKTELIKCVKGRLLSCVNIWLYLCVHMCRIMYTRTVYLSLLLELDCFCF